jgi:hypothetical protein
MYLVGEAADYPLREDIITFDAFKVGEYRVKVVTLAEEEVVRCAFYQSDPRLQIETRMY